MGGVPTLRCVHVLCDVFVVWEDFDFIASGIPFDRDHHGLELT